MSIVASAGSDGADSGETRGRIRAVRSGSVRRGGPFSPGLRPAAAPFPPGGRAAVAEPDLRATATGTPVLVRWTGRIGPDGRGPSPSGPTRGSRVVAISS